MLDLEDVHAFAVVAEAGGLSRAGSRLGMSKSMLSRRLTRLESYLGVRLLARTTRGVALTEAGADFKAYADRIVGEMQAGRDAVSREGQATGRLRIAAPLSFGATHLGPVLAELALRHPQLEIQTSYSDRRVDLISEGFDVAVRLGSLPDSSLVARRIAPMHATLVASPGYVARAGAPETPADLEGHEAVRQGEEVWRFYDGGREVAIRPQGRFVADSGQALVAAVKAGLGVSLLPSFLTVPAISRGELVKLLPGYPVPEAGLYVVRPPPGNPTPVKIKVLTELLVERFGRDDRWNCGPLDL
jgi:DNA-binding transcriptional LysR family regulator